MVWCIREHGSFQQPRFQLHPGTGRYQRGREGMLAWEQVLALLESAAQLLRAPPSFHIHCSQGKRRCDISSQHFDYLLAEASHSWGADPHCSWTAQRSSTRGMESNRGSSQHSITQTVGTLKLYFYLFVSDFFFNKDKGRDRSCEGEELNCYHLTSVIRLMKCQSIQLWT